MKPRSLLRWDSEARMAPRRRWRRQRSLLTITAPWQGPVMALMAVAGGASMVTETIFENRFMHVAELQRMGADIELQGHTAIVRGRPRLQGAQVRTTRSRSGYWPPRLR